MKTIGIVGGVGPQAGVDLASKVIKNTLASSDQEHIPMLLMSYPHKIRDRTAFLQGRHSENPAYVICQLIRQLESCGARVIGLPCNTAHSSPIMGVIVRQLIEDRSEVTLINMLEAVAEFIVTHFSTSKRIGLLATLGTYQNATYQAAFSEFGLTIIVPDNGVKQSVHQAIYDAQYGIKSALSLNLNQAKRMLDDACAHLADLGAEVIVLGCTEIPLALTENHYQGIPLIDPANILARKLVEFADCKKLKPY